MENGFCTTTLKKIMDWSIDINRETQYLRKKSFVQR